jgi:hypothetical protein
MPKHRVKLHHQVSAISRAHDILKEIYPARILQKKATREGADLHLDFLLAAMETVDGLAERRDMREDL